MDKNRNNGSNNICGKKIAELRQKRIPKTSQRALADLLQLEGIVDGEEMGDHRFRLSFKDVNGVVERLVETSVEKKWQLVEVGVEKKSLDAIFAELSKKK